MVGNIVAASHGDPDDKFSLVHMIPRASEPARHDRHSFSVDITRIAVPRPVGSAGHHEVKTYLAEELRKAGLEPYRAGSYILPYNAPGESGLANVVGILPGSDPSLQPLLIGAHYDTCGYTPGADDNAAAICIAFVAIEIVRKMGLKRSVILALFDAEESPFCLDLVGHDIPFRGLENLLIVTGMESNPALERALTDTRAPTAIRVLPARNSYAGDLSDHHIFRINHIPYLFFSCGRWEHYHMGTDTIEKLNFSKMHAIAVYLARLLTACDHLSFAGVDAAYDPTPTELRMMNAALEHALPAFGFGQLRSRLDIDAVAQMLMNRVLL
jgi:hypothetical protein